MTGADAQTLHKANAILERFGHQPITEESFHRMGVRARASFLAREVADCSYAIQQHGVWLRVPA